MSSLLLLDLLLQLRYFCLQLEDECFAFELFESHRLLVLWYVVQDLVVDEIWDVFIICNSLIFSHFVLWAQGKCCAIIWNESPVWELRICSGGTLRLLGLGEGSSTLWMRKSLSSRSWTHLQEFCCWTLEQLLKVEITIYFQIFLYKLISLLHCLHQSQNFDLRLLHLLLQIVVFDLRAERPRVYIRRIDRLRVWY